MRELNVSTGSVGLAASTLHNSQSTQFTESSEHSPLTVAIVQQEQLLKNLEDVSINLQEKMNHLLHPNQQTSSDVGQSSEPNQAAPVVHVINRNNDLIRETIVKLNCLIKRIC